MDRQHRCARVVDDGGHFRRRQSPVDRDVHRSHQRAAEQEVEVRDAVAVEEGDPVADAEPFPLRRLRHTARDVELLGPRSGAPRPATSISSFAWLARQVTQQARHRVAVLFSDIDVRCHP